MTFDESIDSSRCFSNISLNMPADLHFIQSVNNVLYLRNESVSFEVYRKYGITPLGQHFVFVVSKFVRYAVVLLIECDGRNIDPTNKDSTSANPLYKQEYFNRRRADSFVESQFERLIKGDFGDNLAENEIEMPANCVQNPNQYLIPGDHLRRFSSNEEHDSIYVGDGKVVHFFSNVGHMNSMDALISATIRTAPLKEFAANETIRIVEQCFRRRKHADITETAIDSVTNMWQLGLHGSAEDRSKLFRKATNREHAFAYICAVGTPRVSPRLELLRFDMKNL